jgi:hypothetical protein
MRKSGALLMMLLASGCKQPTSDPADSSPRAPAAPLIQSQGCTVSKFRGRVTVSCADGSRAEGDVGAWTLRDRNGVNLTDLVFLDTNGFRSTVLNKVSGHVLSYNGDGSIHTISRTFYEFDNCQGTIFTAQYDQVLKNKVSRNNNAYPGSGALRITGFLPGALNMRSMYENGVCVSYTGMTTGFAIVEPAEFASSDPQSLALPLEVVYE